MMMTKLQLKPDQEICGYTIDRMTELPTIDAVMVELTHNTTRAKHIHIATRDKENTFGVLFRTIPEDSTGVAHILEHTVLCGSKKFDVRDPFFSMLKRSLSTFMNAFTASDWTMYPFSTQNEKDYYNLMDVYLDAAFFPHIDELSFKQEGHRLEVIEADDGGIRLDYKGVVYNEMKGAMSSPSQVMGRSLLAALYPDTPYKNNSGGEPGDIPKLTWKALKDFHATYYHPSNAFFYTYGNLSLEEHLAFISSKVLDHFDLPAINAGIPAQPRWSSPKTFTQKYAYTDGENRHKKYQACVAWLTCDIQNTFEVLVLAVLEQILIGNAASPLRKALIDSGLGSALSDGTSFDSENRDTMFACGLKDIEKTDAEAVEKIIFQTLETLNRDGIEKNLIDSAIHQIEFHRKEITNTPYPFGIKLLLSITGTLIHDGDPANCINIDKDLEKLNQAIEKGRFLEERIQHYFIDNPHRLLFILEPDPDLEKETLDQTTKELDDVLQRISPEEIQGIQKDANALEQRQEKPDDISVLPTLELEDIPAQVEIILPDAMDGVGPATCYDKATSGILYFTCPVGAGSIPAKLFALVPFFCKAFTNSGTKHHSYEKMAEMMDLYTGGVLVSPFSGTYFSKEASSHSFLAIHGKALDRHIVQLFDLVKEFLEACQFTDFQRIYNLLLQYQAAMEASIVSTGHRYAISLSSRHLSKAAHINELWHGIAQYQFIKSLTKPLENRQKAELEKILEPLCQKLTAIAAAVFKQENFKPALIGQSESVVTAASAIQSIVDGMPENNGASFYSPNLDLDPALPNDGWITNTSVSFVGQSFKTVGITHEDAPGIAVISKMLRSLFLHREIREKGGAYGGFAIYNTEEGIFSFGSYRDPHIKRTLDVYDRACEFIMSGNYDASDIKEAILQVCAEIDKPETPGPAAMKAFYRKITKLDDEIRQQFKDALLRLDKKQVQKIARNHFSVDTANRGTAVISSQALLDEANAQLEKEGRQLTLKKI